MNWKKLWIRGADETLGALYPVTCPGCDDPIPADRSVLPICPECGPKLEEIRQPYCQICGQTFSGRIESDFTCSNCSDRNLSFEFAVGSYAAKGLARDLMHRFKYGRNIHLVPLLGRLMEPALRDSRISGVEKWVLVPVPLHRRRFQDRGFNQALELCRIIRKRFPDRFRISQAISRVRNTRTQAGLDREERLTNLKGAFALSRWKNRVRRVRGANVLLVDDVLTTGATASECARVLKNAAGVKAVAVVTVLRG
ncbi:MAG: ComF family protein [Verrucomicrobiales bacterium]|nr:ComF family protein [Verrucomicrobiales bacterium]